MQGFNQGRYVPPEHEGVLTGNALHGRRAAGSAGRDGSQTVRFEMPFAVWCDGCGAASASSSPTLIGQGVRFNAAKRRVGRYLSTPIWAFRFRHPACGTALEIRTDPQHTRYVVTEGGKARDYGEEKEGTGEGGLPILTPDEQERRKEDAFAALEGKAEEKAAGKDNARRIGELYEAGERDWRDPWAANRKMRDGFRRERKVRQRAHEADEALKTRLGTDMDLLPATEQDSRRAALITFGDDGGDGRSKADSAALFRTHQASRDAGARRDKPVSSRSDALRKQLVRNTRAAINPFG